MRRSIPNSKKLRKRLVIEGHKYFNKVVVSGEETEVTLNKFQDEDFKAHQLFRF